ncbi:MAG TPA: hydrogenase 3 maturation endopeptidase HyCI [Anaerolineales bacterium]
MAVLGIGNELRGDDAAGLYLVRALQPSAAGHDCILVLECGPAPENFSGLLRRFSPSHVLLVDAALLGAPPGSLCFLEPSQAGVASSTFTSHALPLSGLAAYLESELGCTTGILAIQPAQDELASSLSPAVHRSVRAAARTLIKELDV